MHTIPEGTSKNAQNPMRNSKYAQNPTRIFRKCTKSHEELPKRHKFCALLEVPRGILYIFGSSMWDFVPFWKFLM
jgi:hypothetical protein